MKLNNDKFYVVYKPIEISEMADIFNGRSNDINGIRLQFKGGMEPDQVYGFYNTKAAAQKDADKVWKKHKSTFSTYGIHTADGIFKFKKQFAGQEDLQMYLDEMFAKGKHYAAYKLTESPKRISKAQLNHFEEKILDSSLNQNDMDQLTKLYHTLREKPASEGMLLVHSFDTFLREFIPSDIWVAMGGNIE